jgi:hypothetical protein
LRRKAVSSAIPGKPNDSTTQVGALATVVGPRFLRLEVTVDSWAFAFVLDRGTAGGELRDVAQTVGEITGVDHDRVLAAMVAAVRQPTANSQRMAAA